jgi:hypothetical protein
MNVWLHEGRYAVWGLSSYMGFILTFIEAIPLN